MFKIVKNQKQMNPLTFLLILLDLSFVFGLSIHSNTINANTTLNGNVSISIGLNNQNHALTSFQSCLENLNSFFITSNSTSYSLLSSGQRPRIQTFPIGIFLASNLDQIPIAVKCAHQNKLHIVPRSGGHSYESLSAVTGSIIIDIAECDAISIQTQQNQTIAIVQAGARLGNVYKTLWEAGNWTFNAGTCPSVGIGGHISGGGFGMQSRKYGLAADRTVAMKVALYNGTIVFANESHHSDLFWAIRGGGSGSFGIVLEFHIKPFKMPQNAMFLITYYDEFERVFDMWQHVFTTAPPEINTQLTITAKEIRLRGHYMGSPSERDAFLDKYNVTAFKNLTVIKRDNCSGLGTRLFFWKDTSCSQFQNLIVPKRFKSKDKEYRKSKSDYASHYFKKDGIQTVIQGMQKSPLNSWIQFEAYGKASIFENQTSEMTPFPNRKGTLFSLQYTVYLKPNENENSTNYEWIRSFETSLKPFVNGNF